MDQTILGPLIEETDLPQVCIGGPMHGAVLPSGERNEPELVVKSFLDNADSAGDLVYENYRYRRANFNILGQRVVFWILDELWAERNRAVRYYIFSALFRERQKNDNLSLNFAETEN